jgi:integrase
MARITTPLSAMAITNLKPLSDKEFKESKAKSKTIRLYDGGGLFIEAPANGRKRWRLKYRFEGKDKLISLGTYPTVTLKNARDIRDEMKTMILNGVDPALERKEKKIVAKLVESESNSLFYKIASQWIAEVEDPILQYINKLRRAGNGKTKINEELIRKKISEGKIKVRRTPAKNTMKRHNSILNNDIIPAIGQMPIESIHADDIRGVLASIMGRGASETAHRALSQIKKIWVYAITIGATTRNTPSDIIPKAELVDFQHKHFRTITDPKIIGQLMMAIDDYGGELTTKLGVKFLAYNAARPGNVRFAEWSEIDFEQNLWVVSSEKMKMRYGHTIPLSSQSIELLKELQSLTGDGKYIFRSSIHKNRPISENTLNVALKRLGFGGDMVAHGFKSMFSTSANNSGLFSRDTIEKAMVHKLGNMTEQAYNRADYLSLRKELMQWWSDYLDEQKRNYIKEITLLQENTQS